MSQVTKMLNLPLSHFTKYGIIRYMCIGKEIVKPSLTPGPDFLLQNLKNATTPKIVLKLIHEHYNILNSKHIMQALRSLFDLQKYGTSDMTTKDILRDPDFEKVCKKLKAQSGLIELNETIEALKVISYVGVPSNSTIVQILLQLIRQNINSLHLPQIMFLDFLLHRFKSSPLVDALKIALPLLFEIHLPLKMDRDNVSHLAENLYYASRARLRENTVDIIIEALNELNEEFDTNSAKSIIWSMTDIEPSENFEPLINKAINHLIVHVDELTYTDIESTLTKLTRRYTKRHPYFYNEVFCDTCANYVIDHDLGLENGVYMLRKLGRMNHMNRYLLDYVSKKAFEDPLCVTNADSGIIYSIVIATALSNYRPVHWNNLKELITKKKNLAAENRREIIWIRFAASLCLLDIYKIDVLTKALNSEYLESLFAKGFSSDLENYFAIWQSIKLNRPELEDILPSKFEPENLVPNMKEIPDFPLEASLQIGVGGEQYVMTSLLSRKGHQIDHAILFRKGGYPVAVNNKEDIKFIEDIEIPKDNELLIILVLRPIQFTINNKLLRESISLSIKILELDGYSVLPISLDVWESLEDFEKIPFLMQNVKNKLESDISISESNSAV